MKEIKFVVKAEQQEKQLKSASFITAEKILFGTEFGEGLLTVDNPIIGSVSVIEEYINNKFLGIDLYDYKFLFTAKATTAISMYILGSQLNKSWRLNAVHANEDEMGFSLSAIDKGIVNCFTDGDDDVDSENELESVYFKIVPDAIKVAETFCNYSPIAEAIINISQLLSKENINKEDVKYINKVLDDIEDFPPQKFLIALELFTQESKITEYIEEDDDVNYRWNILSQ